MFTLKNNTAMNIHLFFVLMLKCISREDTENPDVESEVMYVSIILIDCHNALQFC